MAETNPRSTSGSAAAKPRAAARRAVPSIPTTPATTTSSRTSASSSLTRCTSTTRISVSGCATSEFKPDGKGTQLIYTEQAVFLDGHDDPGDREHGTRALFDNLEAALKREAVN